jgi:hypothetical protein
MTIKQPKQKKADNPPKPPKEIVIDFDSNWKFLIVKYHFPFIEFFMPELYADIDTSRAPVFLDSELQTIWRSMKTGLKMTDKLVKVWLKNGEERWILVHIEIQARFETLFSKRMYTMSYRILDKYQVEMTALAVFVDTPIPSQFDTYETKFYGTETRYKYNAYKVIEQTEAELLESDNLFALVVLANLYTIKTKKEGEEFNRLAFKKHLYNLVIERNFDLEVYHDLINFIDYLMVLPEQLSIEYDNFTVEKTKKTEEMNKMKPGPRIKNIADAIYYGAYGVDIAAEREATKRQIQVEKRKAKFAEAKFKNVEVKAKDAEVKAKDAEVKAKDLMTKLVLALRINQTVEQIAENVGMSIEEVKHILNAHPA